MLREKRCIIVLKLVKIDQMVAQILKFLDFSPCDIHRNWSIHFNDIYTILFF